MIFAILGIFTLELTAAAGGSAAMQKTCPSNSPGQLTSMGNQAAVAKLSNSNMSKVAEHMAPGNKFDAPIIPGPNGQPAGCDSNGVEGNNPAALKQKLCLEKAKQEQRVINAVQKKMQQKKDCSVKVNKRSMICHTKKVMQDVVHKPKYKIENINNIITLKVADRIVLAEVVETLSYDVQEVNKPRETQLEEPKYAVMFNTIGGLVDQKGTPPSQAKPKNDPCSECLQQLNMQASSVEGGVDDCSFTCDDDGMQQFINAGYFTVSKSPAKTKEEGSSNQGKTGGE